MINDDISISRESSKEKVNRIHRLRVEIEKIREENSFLIHKLNKYDNWLIESVDEINNLLDKNISDDTYDYEEESIEYDFDPNDLNFGEKKKSKAQNQKKNNKLAKYFTGNEENGINGNDDASNKENLSSQLTHKTEPQKKEKNINPPNPSEKTTKSKQGLEKKAILKTSTLPINQSTSNNPQTNSSPLEILFKLNPQLAAQILRPFIDELKKKNAQKAIEKTEDITDTSNSLEKNQKSDSVPTEEKPIDIDIETFAQSNADDTSNLSNENNSQESKNMEEEPFDDL